MDTTETPKHVERHLEGLGIYQARTERYERVLKTLKRAEMVRALVDIHSRDKGFNRKTHWRRYSKADIALIIASCEGLADCMLESRT